MVDPAARKVWLAARAALRLSVRKASFAAGGHAAGTHPLPRPGEPTYPALPEALSKKAHIASEAFPSASVGPDGSGGAQHGRGEREPALHPSPTTAATSARSLDLTVPRSNFFADCDMRTSAAASVMGGFVSPFFARWNRTGLMRATT